MLTEKLGVEPDVTRLVYTVNIAKGSGNAEIGGDLAESLVNVPDVLRLRVEGRVVNVLIVHTVLFTTSNADLHFEPDTDLSHTLEVFKADLDVVFFRFLRKVKHVRAEQRLAMLGKPLFVSCKHTIEPRQKFLGTVVRVQNHRDTVVFGNRTHVVRACHRASYRGLLFVVGKALTSEVRGTSVRHLNDDRRLGFTRRLKSGIGNRRGRHIESRDGKVVFTGIVIHLVDVVTRNNTSWNNVKDSHYVLSSKWLCG